MSIATRVLLRTLLLAAFGLALSACSDDKSRFVGFNSCDKYGVPVWYVYPNAQGSYDTADVKPENCTKH